MLRGEVKKLGKELRLLYGPRLKALRRLTRRAASAVVTVAPPTSSAKLWRAVARVVTPGGYCLAISTPLGYHRLTCALEDAGWLIKDCLFVFTSAEVAGEVVPQQLVVTMAMKPMRNTYAGNALRYGTAGLNIDGCRVGNEAVLTRGGGGVKYVGGYKTCNPGAVVNQWHSGRWPANALFVHSARCVYVGTSRVRSGDGLSRGSGGFQSSYVGGKVRNKDRPDRVLPYVGSDGKEKVEVWRCHPKCVVYHLDLQSAGSTVISYGDSGGASRFFQTFASEKISPPRELLRYLCRFVAMPRGGTVLDPFLTEHVDLAEAVKDEGLSYIGVAVSADVLRTAAKRLKQRRAG